MKLLIIQNFQKYKRNIDSECILGCKKHSVNSISHINFINPTQENIFLPVYNINGQELFCELKPNESGKIHSSNCRQLSIDDATFEAIKTNFLTKMQSLHIKVLLDSILSNQGLEALIKSLLEVYTFKFSDDENFIHILVNGQDMWFEIKKNAFKDCDEKIKQEFKEQFLKDTNKSVEQFPYKY